MNHIISAICLAGALLLTGSRALAQEHDHDHEHHHHHHHFEYSSTDNRYFSIQAGYAHRFVIGGKQAMEASEMPYRGEVFNLTLEVPLLEGSGVCVQGVAGPLAFRNGNSFYVYAGRVGLFWEREFSRVLELEVQTLIGYAGHKNGNGIDLSAAASLNIIPCNHLKFRAGAEWETFSYASRETSTGKPYLNSILLGVSAVIFW